MMRFGTALKILFGLSSSIAIDAQGCGLVIDEESGRGNVAGYTAASREFSITTNLSTNCFDAESVVVQLTSSTSGIASAKTFMKTVTKGHVSGLSSAYWAGEANDGSMLNYVSIDGKTTGSIVDMARDEVSQFSTDGDGVRRVIVTPSSAFPEELDPLEDSFRERELGNLRGDASADQVDQSNHNHRQHGRQLEEDGSRLDILVVWTQKAECDYSGLQSNCGTTDVTEANMKALINLAVEETNTAYTLSGVETQLNLVHSEFIDYDESSGFSAALSDLRGNNDGKMDNVHSLRTTHNADIVALIISNPQYCGIAYLGPSKGSMFSVTGYSCATGYYSFGHEIGHNQGCNHDKGTSGTCSSSAYNYGYRDPNANFRSILAYNCKSGECDNISKNGCTRVQRFSNPTYKYLGADMGNAVTDNARRINDVKKTIANYFVPSDTSPPTNPPTSPPTNPPTSPPTNPPTSPPTNPPTSPPTNPPTSPPTDSPVASPVSPPKNVGGENYHGCTSSVQHDDCVHKYGGIWVDGDCCPQSQV